MSDPDQEPIAPDAGEVASAPTAAAESAPNSPLQAGATAEPAESSAPVADAPAAEATAPTEDAAPSAPADAAAESAPASPATAGESQGTPEPKPAEDFALGQPPTPQPPLPGGIFFDEHGGAQEPNPITEPRRIYVDATGKRISVRVLAQRDDGSVDIALPATVGEIRRDGVRRQVDADQKGDFIE